MKRKLIVFVFCFALLCSFGAVAQAETYEPYDSAPSSTYISYFRDIVSGIGFNENYVALRSGQYEYVLLVGDIQYGNGIFTSADIVRVYTITTDNGYNSNLSFVYSETDSLYIDPDTKIVYSDLGHYPQLIQRGEKYEMFTALLVCVALLCIVVGRFFRKR